MSISATTRPCRAGETEGTDYLFVDQATFVAMRDAAAFLEHARVYDHFYGTPRAPVEAALAAGRDILFTIDWQGARKIAQLAAADLVRVFILPPGTEELERRLRQRGRDSDVVVAGRMAQAFEEISHCPEYDYVVVNADFEVSLASLRAILAAERLRRSRLLGLAGFMQHLRSGKPG